MRTSLKKTLADEDLQLLRKEFHAFWHAGLRGQDYLDQSAIVCYLDLDQEEITLTRIFYCAASDGEERAEDLMIDWFQEDLLIQKAKHIEVNIYMNYSPLKLTVDGLITVFNNLKEMGKKVRVVVKFVELYKTESGEEDAEENREGLRNLEKYAVKVDVVKERDWVYLMQTLTQNSAKKQQVEKNTATRQRLLRVLRDPQDKHTNTQKMDLVEGTREGYSP
ncbi:uncharacterized protein LOC143300186 [Babylonia areolata]